MTFIQVSWIIISVFGLMRSFFLNRRIQFNSEEKEFLQEKFPALSKPLARELLNRGVWISGDPGTILTKQGVENSHLIFLRSGSADVMINDDIIAQCEPGNFIGEMTLHDGSPASATVRLREESRYLNFDANGLRELSKRESLIAQALDASFARDLRKKLHAKNP